MIMSLDTVHSTVMEWEYHSSAEVFKINSLPRELLPKIFEYLNVHDRKNVRLTCRLWNDVCNLEEIIKYEKFVFHPGKEGCDLSELGAHIEECKAPRSCWQFEHLPLYQLPSTVWANCGERVQSLFLHGCKVDDRTIFNIIIHCSNLKTFRLQSAFDLDWYPYDLFEDSDENNTDEQPGPPDTLSDPDAVFCTEEGIDELIKRKVERRNLTSLILFIPEILSTRKLRKLFQIFPCVRTFGHGLLIFQFLREGFQIKNPMATEWVFPPTMEILVSHVEDDILNSLKISKSKLKVFSTILDFNDTPYGLFLDLCSEQKELEKLALDVTCRGYDDKDILFLILRSLPKLKELEFHVCSSSKFWYLPENLSEFLVLTSKLERMSLDFGPMEDSDFPVIASSSPVEYSALKRLNISIQTSPNFIYEILRRCRTSLQHLHLVRVDDKILQLILEAHTELKTLFIYLKGLYKPNKDGSIPEGKKYPFGKLKNLEYLRIHSIDTDTLRNNESEFIFPKLKYFEIDCSQQNLGTMLRVVCQGAPYLETLKLRISTFKSIDFVNLFGNVQMKCLRYIIIHSLKNPLTGELLKDFGSIDAVFNVCPSLCLMSFVWDGRCTYSYNRHSKEVKRHELFNKFDPVLYGNILSP